MHAVAKAGGDPRRIGKGRLSPAKGKARNGRFNARGRGAKVMRSLPRDTGWSFDTATGMRMRMRRRRGGLVVKACKRSGRSPPAPQIVRARRRALRSQFTRALELAASERRIDQQLREKVALRVAAAERDQSLAQGVKALHAARIVADPVCDERVRERQADVRRHPRRRSSRSGSTTTTWSTSRAPARRAGCTSTTSRRTPTARCPPATAPACSACRCSPASRPRRRSTSRWSSRKRKRATASRPLSR